MVPFCRMRRLWSADGFVAGLQGGYNWQSRCTVFGIEADYNWANVGHDELFTDPVAASTLPISSQLKSFGTIRTRSGVVVENLLLYVTGGLAYAKNDRSVALNVPRSRQRGPLVRQDALGLDRGLRLRSGSSRQAGTSRAKSARPLPDGRDLIQLYNRMRPGPPGALRE